jgi:acetyl-CoA acetyltransferase
MDEGVAMSTKYQLGGVASIAGVGSSPFGRFPDRGPIGLAVEALREAVDDAALSRDDVDGLVTNMGYPLGVDYDQFAAVAGLRTTFNLQLWTHGRWLGAALEQAAAAVALGLCRCVAVVCAAKFSVLSQLGGAEDHEASREGGGSHGEVPYIGLMAPGSGAALSARIYLERYDATEADLGAVAMTARDAARRNPGAWRREPLDLDTYLASRYIVAPLRVHDFAQVTDGACAVLVMRAQEAADRTPAPVTILATQSIPAGPDEFIFGRKGLGVGQQPMREFRPDPRDVEVYTRAGVEQSDVDALYTYDAFSPLVWFTLERLGFCAEGEAAAFCARGGIAADGPLPVNTNGGLLAEAHVAGWNSVVEMVRQLRGLAGDRQLARAGVLQWATSFGDSFLLSGAA